MFITFPSATLGSVCLISYMKLLTITCHTSLHSYSSTFTTADETAYFRHVGSTCFRVLCQSSHPTKINKLFKNSFNARDLEI